MKKITLITFILLSSLLYAQGKFDFGFKGGLSIVNLKEKSNGLNSFDPIAKVSYHFGGFLTFNINEKIALQPEIIFSSQGAKQEIEFTTSADLPSFVSKPEFTLNYINIPIYFKYNITQGFSIFTGPQFSFLTSAKLKSIETDMFAGSQPGREFESDIKDTTSTFDLSLSLGAGYQFNFGLLVQANYNLGFINTIDSNQSSSTRKNRVFQLSLGYKL